MLKDVETRLKDVRHSTVIRRIRRQLCKAKVGAKNQSKEEEREQG
jgi:hypothetical protein